MATTTTITTTYAGEFLQQYISAALLSANTLENGGLTIKPNIKFKEVIKKVATGSGLIGDAGCDFVSTSSVDLTERIIQPEEFQVNVELCKKDFRSDWEAIEMGLSVYDNLPPSFSDFLVGHVLGKIAEQTEQNIWKGVNANPGEFDGLTTLMLADADVNDVTGTTVTAANVIDELGKIVDAIPSTIYGKEDLHIYISQNIARAYVRALGGFGSIASNAGANGVDNKGTLWYGMGQNLAFDGVKLFVANGLADNTAVAAEKSNLYFGTGLASDMNELKVLDMSDLDGSQNVRVIARFTAGVQYGIGSDIVLYS
jgi:hypothetical protein